MLYSISTISRQVSLIFGWGSTMSWQVSTISRSVSSMCHPTVSTACRRISKMFVQLLRYLGRILRSLSRFLRYLDQFLLSLGRILRCPGQFIWWLCRSLERLDHFLSCLAEVLRNLFGLYDVSIVIYEIAVTFYDDSAGFYNVLSVFSMCRLVFAISERDFKTPLSASTLFRSAVPSMLRPVFMLFVWVSTISRSVSYDVSTDFYDSYVSFCVL